MVKDAIKEAGVMDQIHALSLKTHTIEEFENNYPEQAAEKLQCRGGSKYDKKNREQDL